MNFPSCIKIPASKTIASESSTSSDLNKESVNYNDLISIANDVFGHGRWSHSVTSQTVDFVEYVMGKYHIGCAAFVRVQLADGTFHEDMGYSITESAAKGSAIYSARSSSIALALKKALLCFGGEIDERINEILPKRVKVKQESIKLTEETSNGIAAKSQKTIGSCVKDTQIVEGFSSTDNVYKTKEPSKPLQSVLTPKRTKSPKPKEPEDALIAIGTDVEVIMTDDCQESSKVTADHINAPPKNGPSTVMTEEEIRLERKRKQKQKQEEYKKLMKEKQLKSDDKPNLRY